MRNISQAKRGRLLPGSLIEWIVLAVAVAFLIYVVRGLALVMGMGPGLLDTRSFSEHPRDQVLAANFRAHRAEFDQILALSRADSQVNRVYYEWNDQKDARPRGITEQRHRQYQALFDALGLHEGSDKRDGESWFFASTVGNSLGSGSGKGYAYADQAPSPIVADLDHYQTKNKDYFRAYKHLEGRWYLFIDGYN